MKKFYNFNFVCGFLIGVFFIITFFIFIKTSQHYRVEIIKNIQNKQEQLNAYESILADKLFDEVRILCYVFTHADNHKTKVVHVKNTWGKRCNKLIFMSTKEDPDIPEIVVLPVENGRSHLWYKARLAMKYVHDHHLDDADWFLRADDDK
jgi:hypothetical protein